jgi:cytochrome c
MREPGGSRSFSGQSNMKTVSTLLLLGFFASSGTAIADDEMYKTKNCFACHRIDRNTLGPSFKSVAAKYANENGADLKLAKIIRQGGVGSWGSVPMPAQNQVTDEEALTLARWVLQLK